MKNYSLIIVFVLLFYLTSFKSLTANSLEVVINEIAWMGTASSANDEWIELYNNSKTSVNLDGWVLKSEDGTPEIKLAGTIPTNNFFLLERTDDNSVPNIAADQIYKGALGNSGENLKLYDSSGNVVNEVNCSAGWFAGKGKPEYKTMERKNPLAPGNDSSNWQSSQNLGGTPKTKNPEQKTINNEQKTEKLAENGSPPSFIKAKEYPSGIIINEILPSPEGSDETKEWIEILNQNNFEVNLFGWKIEDVSGKITTYTFPKEMKISLQGFLVLSREKTKITLNNDEDGLILTSPDGKIIDEVNYKKAPQEKSYNRVNSNWLWSANLTPGTPNITEKTENPSPEDKAGSETKEKRELAAVGEQLPRIFDSLYVFLIALGLAIFSGVIIFILKKKLKEDRSI